VVVVVVVVFGCFTEAALIATDPLFWTELPGTKAGGMVLLLFMTADAALPPPYDEGGIDSLLNPPSPPSPISFGSTIVAVTTGMLGSNPLAVPPFEEFFTVMVDGLSSG